MPTPTAIPGLWPHHREHRQSEGGMHLAAPGTGSFRTGRLCSTSSGNSILSATKQTRRGVPSPTRAGSGTGQGAMG